MLKPRDGSQWRASCAAVALLAIAGLASHACGGDPPGLFVLDDDGGWCWFQDERALVDGDKLLVGSAANGRHDPQRAGDIDLLAYDLGSGKVERVELHDRLQADDHDVPALLIRPDGRILAVYAKHGPENVFYYRLSLRPHDVGEFGPIRQYSPSAASRITYSNLHFLAAENGGQGRLYNFFRGLDNSFKPSYAYSDDGGDTWSRGGIVIDVPLQFRHRPYVKYASNGRDAIHLLYTDGHPRNYDNSIYHIFYREGQLHRSDGQVIRSLEEGLKDPAEGTRVFPGDPDNVAWSSDLHLDDRGWPVAVYSVQKDSANLPPAEGGQDHRYRYARWDGRQWRDYEIAYAGRRLYPREDDYTGNIALDPDNLSVVYISTDAHPASGEPLVSQQDGLRHYELFRGATSDGGASWTWTSLTENSTADNLRPLVAPWRTDRTAVLWLRGKYHAYTKYELSVVGVVLQQEPSR